ncbi:hypothetical protein ACFQV2_25680 [Actinokineospora soli]|uniref:Uncharacterized protein n=1 Tax=Actinokineospora soli TaxID=1048753 RepID=A0ABW2TRD5_9PSEU
MASRRAPDDPGPAQAVKVVASVAANVTVATALLYYFGFLYTQRFFSYFRVHYTVLDQSPYEILARGVDGLMMPLAGVTGVALVVLAAVRILRYRLSERAREVLLAVCTPLAAAAGLLLVTVTVYIALEPAPFREYAGLPGLAFAVGILLLILPWQRWSRPKGAPATAPGRRSPCGWRRTSWSPWACSGPSATTPRKWPSAAPSRPRQASRHDRTPPCTARAA